MWVARTKRGARCVVEQAPYTLDSIGEATHIRTSRSCCNNSPVHTACTEQRITQKASEWDLAPFIRIASRVASSVDGAWNKATLSLYGPRGVWSAATKAPAASISATWRENPKCEDINDCTAEFAVFILSILAVLFLITRPGLGNALVVCGATLEL